jgi:predicted Zn-dependent protease
MAPRSSSPLRVKFAVSLVFEICLLALAMFALNDSKAFGQSLQGAGPVVARSPVDLKSLLLLAQPPEVEVSLEATEPKVKIPEKYDVSLIGQRRVDQGVNFYTLDKEMAMGKQMAQELEIRSRMLNDPVVTEYVNELGQRLARRSDIKEPLVIKVVDSDEVNAYALPGGYFYVNTGLILAAQSEAELAAVMAHEIAHIAARHATRNMTKMQIWNIASIPMMFFGGPIGMAVREVSTLAMPLSINKFSRDAEREADLLGIEYEYAAGYDPNAFVEFFERIKSSGKQNPVAKAFSSHPMNKDRISRAQKEIKTMLPPRSDYVVDTSEFHQMQARLLGRLYLKPAFGTANGNAPVLRRRDTSSQSPSSDSGKPELKRR